MRVIPFTLCGCLLAMGLVSTLTAQESAPGPTLATPATTQAPPATSPLPVTTAPSTSPLLAEPCRMVARVAACMVMVPLATATRRVTRLSATSTMCAWPAESKCVRGEFMASAMARLS